MNEMMQTSSTAPADGRRVRLICVEEHFLDGSLAAASGPATLVEAPYLADWGSRVEDGLRPRHPARPHVVSNRVSAELLPDLGARRLERMDAAGVDLQVLSVGGSPQHAPAELAVDLNRIVNDRLAETVRAHPDRFAGFAALPWQHPSGAAAELHRAVTSLGLHGTLINGRPGDTFLDDPRYDEVLAVAADLGVPVYVHPGVSVPAVQQAYYAGFDREVSARFAMFGWGWHHEAGIQVIRMILGGVFDRHPGLQVISGHWGEMVPYYLERLDDAIPQEASGLSRSISDTYRQHVSVTPSGMLSLPQFEFCRSLLGADRILFSLDDPYQSMDGCRPFLDALPVSSADRARIAHRNAEKLLALS